MLHILALAYFAALLLTAVIALTGTWLAHRELILRALGWKKSGTVSLPALPVERLRSRARVIRTVSPSRVLLKAA